MGCVVDLYLFFWPALVDAKVWKHVCGTGIFEALVGLHLYCGSILALKLFLSQLFGCVACFLGLPFFIEQFVVEVYIFFSPAVINTKERLLHLFFDSDILTMQ